MWREWRDDIVGAFPFVLGHGPISVRAVAFWIVVSIPVISVAWQLYAAHEEATERPEWANDLMQEIKRDMLAAIGGATREERERRASSLIDSLEVLFAKSAPGGQQINVIATVFEGNSGEGIYEHICCQRSGLSCRV
jgi:hypothetical protein